MNSDFQPTSFARRLIITIVACVFATPFVTMDAAANNHGVETIQIITSEDPPSYDLSQVEKEVADGIKRAKRNYWLRGALVGGSGFGSTGNECRSQGAGLEVFQMMCEVAVAAGEAAEQTKRGVEANIAVKSMNSARGDSDPELAPELSSNIDTLLASDLQQLRLAAAVGKVVSQQTNIRVVAKDSTIDPGHQLSVDLLKVEAVGNKVDPKIAIQLHGEAVLTSNDDGAILDSYSYVVRTPKYDIENWSQGGIGLLAISVDEAITRMAEVLAEEVLLVVTSPRQRGKGYLVIPVAPKLGGTFRSDGFVNPGGSFLPTGTLDPTFKWKDFRNAYTRDPLYADVSASELDVSYDLRVYRARPSETGKALLIAGEILHEQRDISGEEFTPDINFVPCTPYLWSIRARFIVGNKIHLTYWSGAYREKTVEQIRQSKTTKRVDVRFSRNVGSLWGMDTDEAWSEEAKYFPLLPTSPGQKCSREDIYAALEQSSL